MNSVAFVIEILFTTMVFSGCVERDNIMGQKNASTNVAQEAYLDQIRPYDSKECTLKTSIGFRNMKEILAVGVHHYDARDQDGRSCLLDSVSTCIIKGGVRVTMFCKIDSNKANKVIVKAVIYFNDTKTIVTCGYRKRTEAERNTVNYNVEWTYIEELEKIETERF